MNRPPLLPKKTRVLGLPVSQTDLAGAEACASEAVSRGHPLSIGVINHNKCWLAHRDPDVRGFLEEAQLVVAESSVVWAARTLGREGVGAAWGVALMGRLLDAADKGGWRVYLLGAEEPVNERLAAKVGERWPGAVLVGRHHGYLTPEDTPRVREEIVALAPDLLLVAMGSPLQERFLASLPASGGPTVRLGVGGSFDVYAGLRKDAPGWLRGSGFEWLWRAVQSPRLFRRYMVRNPWFVFAVLRERWTGRIPGGAG